ncbi:hypothetical protein Aglo03_38030 [Actinokineospora globicatena]|uniref:Mop domain-containing protein n=2 Tax=Actinokineospora globicatena TaxID=103729 RepID=A0A9W6V951_9PSEU|nr:hypothetical protein Aglo03_38030 [Actinokineospora globicatena]
MGLRWGRESGVLAWRNSGGGKLALAKAIVVRQREHTRRLRAWDPARRGYCRGMPYFRVAEAARLLGVSDDTVRRWIDAGQLSAEADGAGRKVVDGAVLAGFAKGQATEVPDPSGVGRSARNRFVGLVTSVVADTVMAQVELQCGPHRVVSLMSSEAVREMGLAPGVLAVALVKATQVIVETPG